MGDIQFSISLELCRGRIISLSDYEERGFIERDCDEIMQKFLLAYCLWLNSLYTVGVNIQGFTNLAASVHEIPGLDKEHKDTMVETIAFSTKGKIEWINLWNIHVYQYLNPHLWQQYQELSMKWFEEASSPT